MQRGGRGRRGTGPIIGATHNGNQGSPASGSFVEVKDYTASFEQTYVHGSNQEAWSLWFKRRACCYQWAGLQRKRDAALA